MFSIGLNGSTVSPKMAETLTEIKRPIIAKYAKSLLYPMRVKMRAAKAQSFVVVDSLTNSFSKGFQAPKTNLKMNSTKD